MRIRLEELEREWDAMNYQKEQDKLNELVWEDKFNKTRDILYHKIQMLEQEIDLEHRKFASEKESLERQIQAQKNLNKKLLAKLDQKKTRKEDHKSVSKLPISVPPTHSQKVTSYPPSTNSPKPPTSTNSSKPPTSPSSENQAIITDKRLPEFNHKL